MKFDKDTASLAVSIVALTVSIASPLVSYRWLNQVERDDKDRKLLTAWIDPGADDYQDLFTQPSTRDFRGGVTIWLRKDGSLSVGNVQLILQFAPDSVNYINATAHSELEVEKPVVEQGGRLRIKLKNALAPTSRDISIDVLITIAKPSKYRTGVLQQAWLFSDATAATVVPVFPQEHPRRHSIH